MEVINNNIWAIFKYLMGILGWRAYIQPTFVSRYGANSTVAVLAHAPFLLDK